MKIGQFFGLITAAPSSNFLAVAPDNLGLLSQLPNVLERVAASEDIHLFKAKAITKEKARQIEDLARKAPIGGSEQQHVFIYGLQDLPTDSVGPLLKAVEDAKFTRFLFQAQGVPKKVETLASRSSIVELPFLPKAMVLANMKKQKKDARTVDEMNLYDGTLDGSVKALRMKDTLTRIRTDLKTGRKGMASLTSEKVLGSLAFDTAVTGVLTDEEIRYAGNDENRKIIALHSATGRA